MRRRRGRVEAGAGRVTTASRAGPPLGTGADRPRCRRALSDTKEAPLDWEQDSGHPCPMRSLPEAATAGRNTRGRLARAAGPHKGEALMTQPPSQQPPQGGFGAPSRVRLTPPAAGNRRRRRRSAAGPAAGPARAAAGHRLRLPAAAAAAAGLRLPAARARTATRAARYVPAAARPVRPAAGALRQQPGAYGGYPATRSRSTLARPPRRRRVAGAGTSSRASPR